jgi:HEAT repeat protein
MNERATSPSITGHATESLDSALRNPDPFVRTAALERVRPGDAVEHLVEQVLGDDYPLVRREAVRALSRIGGTGAARALLRASAHDLSAEVREEAVSALAGMLRSGSEAVEA